MQGEFGRLRADWQSAFNIQLGLATGIGLGMVVAGSIGSTHHQDYTVSGDAVTIAQALNEQAHGGEIFMSYSIRVRMAYDMDGIAFDYFSPVRVKGKPDEHEVELVRAEGVSASTWLLADSAL